MFKTALNFVLHSTATQECIRMHPIACTRSQLPQSSDRCHSAWIENMQVPSGRRNPVKEDAPSARTTPPLSECHASAGPRKQPVSCSNTWLSPKNSR
ncbi:hypothetical protein M758_7G061800, partial [Ceratodon purpureus]